MDGRGNYSTLEVAQGAYQQPGVQAEKQVAVADDSLPQPIPPSAPDCYKQDLGAGNGVNAYVQNNGYINTQQYVSPYEPGGYYSQPPQQPPPPVVAPSGRGKKWMCGLPPRVFWIIVGVAAVLVGVAATVASVVVMRKNQSGDGSGSQGSSGTNSTLATDPDAPILPGTRLAVGNWTDASTRFTHRAVVYQTRYALMVTYWDDSNRSWASVNVSASLARANNAITVKEGSPFAIGVTGSPWPFQMSIYYLTPQNVIGEVFCKNETTMDDWRIGDIHRRALRRAAPNTQLTSQWHRCSFGCSQHIYVVYEDDQNTIQLINSTDIQRQNVVVSNVTPGSALTMIPFLGENAKNGYQPYELRLFYQDSDLQEYKFNADRTWSKGETLARGLTVAPQAPIFASTVFSSWSQAMVVALNPNGTLTAHRYDGTKWNFNQRLTFTNGPPDPVFESIAMNHDRGFYGVIGDTIHEYSMQFDDPYNLVYGGTVLTPRPSKANRG